MLTKEQKKNYISEMSTQFENSKAVMVTHYQGLTMTQLDELRAQMREHGIIFKITKNRITKLAIENTKCPTKIPIRSIRDFSLVKLVILKISTIFYFY